uniref:Kallikrein-8 n=1 Tax=Anoplopoma fimbria TaxID=229290 RepID=C3KHF3_ANOFI|nr:Kallikrein-8 precursor [Anoplopoma fimbria]
MGGMTRLLLLLWAGVTVGTVVDLQKRIIGGQDCLTNESRYHVQLRKSEANGPFELECGGSLISPQWILTAAHCWDETWTMRTVLGVHPGPGTPVAVTPHFFMDNQNRKHDIMLLEITDPNIHHTTIIPLPNCQSRLNEGDEVQIAGHASKLKTFSKLRISEETVKLQCANTEVVNCQKLRNCLPNSYPDDWQYLSYQHWLCCQRAGVDLSKGDSGGGVVFNGMLYGVNSFIGNGTHACVEAAGFMDVCEKEYMDWILKTTGIKP